MYILIPARPLLIPVPPSLDLDVVLRQSLKEVVAVCEHSLGVKLVQFATGTGRTDRLLAREDLSVDVVSGRLHCGHHCGVFGSGEDVTQHV